MKPGGFFVKKKIGQFFSLTGRFQKPPVMLAGMLFTLMQAIYFCPGWKVEDREKNPIDDKLLCYLDVNT
jgi:hypothetical protein